MKTIFNQSINSNQSLRCVNLLKCCWLWLLSSLAACLPTGISFAPLVIPGGLRAYLHHLHLLTRNKRQLIGGAMLVGGLLQVFFHQLFFSESVRDFSWYYVNWYYFLFTLRPYLVLIWWSAGFVLFIPTKYRLAFIPASLFQAIGWCGVFHYSFFVNSNEAFHTLPLWEIIVASLCLGFALIMSLEYLAHWWNHTNRGNHTRFVGIAESSLTPEQKEPIYNQLAKEFRATQKQI